MPLDQSIVFDGGWRILSGQVPYQDFHTPNGLVPIFIQGAFFKLFGVTWFFYCLHAAIFNGLFCILVYCLLRLLQGSKPLSFFYAFLSGIVFYPPFGVPYMDQHAFFFVLLAFLITLLACKSKTYSGKLASWILLFPILSAAFLCKQIPTVIALPILLILLLATTEKTYFTKMLIATSASLAGSFLIGLAAIQFSKIDTRQFLQSIFGMSQKTGFERIHDFILYAPLGVKLKSIFYPFSRKMSIRLMTFDLIYILMIAMLIAYALISLRPRPKNGFKPFFYIILSIALLVICNLFVLITLNEGENGIPYIFASLGVVHIAFFRLMDSSAIPKKTSALKWIFGILIITLAIFDSFHFNKNVNRPRSIHELGPNARILKSSASLPAGLKFMKFGMPADIRFRPDDIKKTVDYIQIQNANFFLIGDTSILYGLTKKPSVNPSLWFHPGLTMPLLGSADFQGYENQLLKVIKKYKVRFLVLEGTGTWNGVDLNAFAKLASLIIRDSAENKDYGRFKIFRIDPNRADILP